MVFKLRTSLRDALGASLSVSHRGPDGVTRVFTVPVVDQGTVEGETTPYPVVQFVGAFANRDPASFDGDGFANEAFVDLHILVSQNTGGNIDPARMLDDIYGALETAVNAVRKTLGSSFFTLASHYRDFPPRQTEAGPYSFTRYVMVRGENLEHL